MTTPNTTQQHPHSFDSFIVSDANQEAFDIARSIAEGTAGKQGSIVFLFGKSGIGKTHLLQAIKESMEASGPYKHARFENANDISNRFLVASARDKRAKSLGYIALCEYDDVFLLDDITCLRGRPESAKYIKHLIDRITCNGGVVVCAGEAESDLELISSGKLLTEATIVPVGPSPVEARVRFVSNLASEFGSSIQLPDDVLRMIAERSENMRIVRGDAIGIICAMKFKGSATISLEKATAILDKH